jgi:hypothetical protein
MLNYYSLPNSVNVTLNTIPAGAGYIKISTIVPDSLPWTGVYFHGNPVKITAVANPGYTFDHWEYNINLPANLLNQESVVVNIATDDYFTAIFTGTASNNSLTISEINYRPDASLDGGNWIELHNYGNTEVNLTGWSLKSDDFYNAYSFSDGVKIPAGGYLVVAQDTQQFHSIYPTVNNVVGNLRFGFENSLDSIYIFRPNSDTLLAMQFSNEAPFPRCANGFGRTLENKYTTSISLDSLSWFCGCIAGSPGEAYFPCDEPVIFSEFNLGKVTIAHNAEDWIELKNNTDNVINFSGYTLKDEKQNNSFSLTGLQLNPGEYAVVVKDSSLFTARHPYFDGKALFQLPYGISRNDALRLYDINGTLLQSVVFDTTIAWPQAPFNSDFTFEYLEANANQSLASNWFQGCEGGSPGRAFSACPVLPDGEFAWLYPNPSNGEITIAIDNMLTGNAGTQIEVFDLSGKLVYNQKFPVVVDSVEPIKMDLGFLSSSMYLIRVTKASQSVTLRLMKD